MRKNISRHIVRRVPPINLMTMSYGPHSELCMYEFVIETFQRSCLLSKEWMENGTNYPKMRNIVYFPNPDLRLRSAQKFWQRENNDGIFFSM